MIEFTPASSPSRASSDRAPTSPRAESEAGDSSSSAASDAVGLSRASSGGDEPPRSGGPNPFATYTGGTRFNRPPAPAVPAAPATRTMRLEPLLEHQGIPLRQNFIWFSQSPGAPIPRDLLQNVLDHAEARLPRFEPAPSREQQAPPRHEDLLRDMPDRAGVRRPRVKSGRDEPKHVETVLWTDDVGLLTRDPRGTDEATTRRRLAARRVRVKDVRELFTPRPDDPAPMRHLAAAFARERGGAFANPASAADIVRLMIIRDGGVYLDVDTKPHYSPDREIWRPNRPIQEAIEVPESHLAGEHPLYLGRGKAGLGSIIRTNNDVVAAPPNSAVIRHALAHIAAAYGPPGDKTSTVKVPQEQTEERGFAWSDKRYTPSEGEPPRSFEGTHTRPGLTMRITGPGRLLSSYYAVRANEGIVTNADRNLHADRTAGPALRSMIDPRMDADTTRWKRVGTRWSDDAGLIGPLDAERPAAVREWRETNRRAAEARPQENAV